MMTNGSWINVRFYIKSYIKNRIFVKMLDAYWLLAKEVPANLSNVNVKKKNLSWQTVLKLMCVSISKVKHKLFHVELVVYFVGGSRCEVISETKHSKQKYLEQRRFDIHSNHKPSTGCRSDVYPSRFVYWMKGSHSWCRIRIDRISFRLQISGFGTKNDGKHWFSEKIIDGFSWKIVYM